MIYIRDFRNFIKNPFNLLLCLCVYFIIFAFLLDSPQNIFAGLWKFVASPDILITDYIFLGGLGATLVNVGLVGIESIALMKLFKCENKGTNIMSIWMMMGFAFFGKNIVNILPIILGGYIYSLYQKRHFSHYLATTLLSTTLAPAVSQMWFLGHNPLIAGLASICMGITIGYILIPIAHYSYRAHNGYNMYNVGFAAGIVSIVLTAILRNAGYTINTVSLWSIGNNFIVTFLLVTVCLFLVICGIILTEKEEILRIKSHKKIKSYKEHFGTIDDAYTTHGEKAYINMGILGFFSTMAIIILNGQISGPIIGGIFTIMGFACLGKNLFNIAPSMVGCILATYLAGWNFNTPSLMLAMLFSATLAPISSNFNIYWGIMAGMLHLNLAVKLGEMSGGLSLYNNGLAGGLVAMVVVPVIFSLRSHSHKAH